MDSLIFGAILGCIGWYIGGLIFNKPKQNTIPVEPEESEENRKPHWRDKKYQGDNEQLNAFRYANDTLTYNMKNELIKRIEEQDNGTN